MNRIAYSWSGTGTPPSPGNVTFQSNRQLVFLSGSGYCSSPNTAIGVEMEVGGEVVANCQIWANPVNTHLAMPGQVIEMAKAPGTYPVSLTVKNGTIIDVNDCWCVTIAELDDVTSF